MINSDKWSPADGLVLEPNAFTAATDLDHNLVLTAGPGAGKTEMLAQRADFLLRTGVCRYPQRILAISFKVDASQNLRARVRRRCGSELAARFDSYTFHAFAKRLIDRFRPALTGRDALDADYSIGQQRIQRRSITFDDMVPLALTIAESSDIARNAIRQTYTHVFLDEFQDCTRAQYRLIRACFAGGGAQLTAVGDMKQRIMVFAGALEGIFETYANDFGARHLTLYQNFRSKPRLRRMQNAMVRMMDPPAALPDEDLSGDEGEINILHFADDEEEADGLADAISRWVHEDGIEPSEIAVLVSKSYHLYGGKLRSALEARDVPFREEDRVQNLAAEPAASLIIDFLLLATGERQPEAHRRLRDLAVLSRGLDEEGESRLRWKWDHFLREAKQRIKAGEIDLADEGSLGALVEELVQLIGLDTIVALAPDYAHGGRLQEIIGETIARVRELMEGNDDPATALTSFSGERAVRIMSIHKSKGLEFDTVLVLGVENETFWGKLNEERSAFFVAISRAKRRLILTTAQRRERPLGAKRWNEARSEQREFLSYAQRYA